MHIAVILILTLVLAPVASSAEADSLKPEQWVRLALFPALAYTPETRFIGGGYLQAILKGDSLRRDSQLAVYATFTQNHQSELGLIPEFWSQGNRWMSRFEINYQNWPSETYGVGIDSREGDESGVTIEGLKLELLLRRSLGHGLYAGIYVRFTRESFREAEAVFPFADDDGVDGGLGLDLSLDTRTSTLAPASGVYHQARVTRHAVLGDFQRTRLAVDLRTYRDTGWFVLATQAALEHSSGTHGFRQLAELGEYLRAHGDTRFIDTSLLAFRAEARRHLFWRFGTVLFAEAGTLAPGLPELRDTVWKTSVGIGGRVKLIEGEDLNLGLDLARGEEGVTVYLRLGEAF